MESSPWGRHRSSLLKRHSVTTEAIARLLARIRLRLEPAQPEDSIAHLFCCSVGRADHATYRQCVREIELERIALAQRTRKSIAALQRTSKPAKNVDLVLPMDVV
jgi:hypothetical protein